MVHGGWQQGEPTFLEKETPMKFGKTKLVMMLLVAICISVPGLILAKGGGHVETAGNNLSLPVIWAEGKSLDMRGVMLEATLDGPYWSDEFGVKWYFQQEDLNYWQAQNMDGSSAPVNVSWIDWGDNMEAQIWTTRSIVRTEVVLYNDLPTPMTGYEMAYLWGDGIEEVWATNGVQYDSTQATVFSWLARYTVQKLAVQPYIEDENGTPVAAIPNDQLGLTWNTTTHQWDGPVGITLYNSAVWEAEGVDGQALSEIYSAELNVPGKVIYGWNWNVKRNSDGAGYYRITFSLDPTTGPDKTPVDCNTFFADGTTQILPGNPGGGIPQIDYVNNLSYIDLKIVAK